MDEVKLSVILLTYNSKIDDINLTLKSIITQQFDSFEVVIADDGSAVFPKAEIESFFEENNFTNYRILVNEKNVGTVKNCIHALSNSYGKYVKLIGAGDLLFDENTLANISSFLDESGCGFGFGLMKSFYKLDEKYIVDDRQFAPKSLRPYQTQNFKKMYFRLMYCRDYICGASAFGKTAYVLDYLHQLEDKVIYCEDYVSVLMTSDSEAIGFLDKFVVYYENSSGISNSTNTSSNQRLLNDGHSLWAIIRERTTDKKLKSYIDCMNKSETIGNPILRTLYRAIKVPQSFIVKYSLYEKNDDKIKGYIERKQI